MYSGHFNNKVSKFLALVFRKNIFHFILPVRVALFLTLYLHMRYYHFLFIVWCHFNLYRSIALYPSRSSRLCSLVYWKTWVWVSCLKYSHCRKKFTSHDVKVFKDYNLFTWPTLYEKHSPKLLYRALRNSCLHNGNSTVSEKSASGILCIISTKRNNELIQDLRMQSNTYVSIAYTLFKFFVLMTVMHKKVRVWFCLSEASHLTAWKHYTIAL